MIWTSVSMTVTLSSLSFLPKIATSVSDLYVTGYNLSIKIYLFINDLDLCVNNFDLYVSDLNHCQWLWPLCQWPWPLCQWNQALCQWLYYCQWVWLFFMDWGFWFQFNFFVTQKKKIINFNFFSLVHSFSIVQSLSAAFSLHLSTSTGFKSLFMTLVKYCTLTVSMFGC